MSLIGVHNWDENYHIVTHLGECCRLRCWQHVEHQASCQPPNALAKRSIPTSGSMTEKMRTDPRKKLALTVDVLWDGFRIMARPFKTVSAAAIF